MHKIKIQIQTPITYITAFITATEPYKIIGSLSKTVEYGDIGRRNNTYKRQKLRI